MPDINKAIVSLYLVEEGFNKGNVFAVDHAVAPNATVHGAHPVESAGAAAFKERIAALRAAFPDVRFTVDFIVAAGDKVVWHWKASGTYQDRISGVSRSDRPVTVTGTSIERLFGGRIVESWDAPDVTSFISQFEAAREMVGAHGRAQAGQELFAH